MNRKPVEHLQRIVDEWNAQFPVGTAVTVRRDNGDAMETKTCSQAWVFDGRTALVIVDGLGGYPLSRVIVRREVKPDAQ